VAQIGTVEVVIGLFIEVKMPAVMEPQIWQSGRVVAIRDDSGLVIEFDEDGQTFRSGPYYTDRHECRVQLLDLLANLQEESCREGGVSESQ
jgi:hypothetical protein